MNKIRDTFLFTIAAAICGHTIVSLWYPPARSAPPTATADLLSEQPRVSTSISNMSDIPINVGKQSRLDLAFCIDTTGSMQGEINTVKAKVKAMVTKITSGEHKPVVRVGLVAYRDIGDEYVTKVFPFSSNIDQVVKDISELNADGGGDGPEAVDMGLHAAINELQWDSNKHTARLLYLIGDAPAHKENSRFNVTTEAKGASTRGICISTIGCQGLESYQPDGPSSFKDIATLTNGNFQTLAYHQELVDSEGHRATLLVSGGKTYKVKSTGKDDWKTGATALLAHGDAVAAPSLAGATNGTIAPQGSDATVITGVNTAGTVRVIDAGRVDNNLEELMLTGARAALSKLSK